jgi:hypothetical protein
MKFASMHVQVPIDDALPVQAVYAHLRTVLEQRGTESVPVKQQPNGEELPAELPTVGRVHWSAVDVVQAVDRTPRKRKPPAKKAAQVRKSARA